MQELFQGNILKHACQRERTSNRRWSQLGLAAKGEFTAIVKMEMSSFEEGRADVRMSRTVSFDMKSI